jgi:hypothetical protein
MNGYIESNDKNQLDKMNFQKQKEELQPPLEIADLCRTLSFFWTFRFFADRNTGPRGQIHKLLVEKVDLYSRQDDDQRGDDHFPEQLVGAHLQ